MSIKEFIYYQASVSNRRAYIPPHFYEEAKMNKCEKNTASPVQMPNSISTFDEFFTYIYLPHIKVRKRSWHIDERLAQRHLSAYFGSSKLTEITQLKVQEWMTELRAHGYAPSSCNRILAILKSVFSLAEALGYLCRGHSPCRDIRAFRLVPYPERFLTKEEGRKLMAYLRADNSLESKIIQLLLLTGARKSEILRAKWTDLDLEKRSLRVLLSKSGKVRHIHLSDEAVSIFKGIRKVSEWIFPGRKPEKPRSDVYRFWHRTRCTLGLENVRLHDLRHSFASFLVAAGHTLYVAQQLLGHTDPRTTMRYAHLDNGALLHAATHVAQILSRTRIINNHGMNCAWRKKQHKSPVLYLKPGSHARKPGGKRRKKF